MSFCTQFMLVLHTISKIKYGYKQSSFFAKLLSNTVCQVSISYLFSSVDIITEYGK